jgi:hypothetical protein
MPPVNVLGRAATKAPPVRPHVPYLLTLIDIIRLRSVVRCCADAPTPRTIGVARVGMFQAILVLQLHDTHPPYAMCCRTPDRRSGSSNASPAQQERRPAQACCQSLPAAHHLRQLLLPPLYPAVAPPPHVVPGQSSSDAAGQLPLPPMATLTPTQATSAAGRATSCTTSQIPAMALPPTHITRTSRRTTPPSRPSSTPPPAASHRAPPVGYVCMGGRRARARAPQQGLGLQPRWGQ